MTTPDEHSWTTHGHPCCNQPGAFLVGDRPRMVARCGGSEAAVAHAARTTEAVTYEPPQPNAALVVGPDDVLLLPPGGEARHDWRVLAAYDDAGRVRDKSYEWTDITDDHARQLIADIRALGRSVDLIMRRTPAGPWVAVSET